MKKVCLGKAVGVAFLKLFGRTAMEAIIASILEFLT